jgi:hypothetical protein
MRRLIRGASTQTIRQQTGDQRADERAEYLAPATRLPVRAVESVDAEAGKGLVGDRHQGTRHRHVTIQSREFLDRVLEANTPTP